MKKKEEYFQTLQPAVCNFWNIQIWIYLKIYKLSHDLEIVI